MTQVAQVMTRGVRALSPEDSLQFAAQVMDDLNVGALPVCEGSKVVGMLTDRDVVVRAAALAMPAEHTQVQEVMSEHVQCCFEDQSLEEAAQMMERRQVRRMPVLDRDQQMVGLLSLGDLAARGDTARAVEALARISEPCEPDRAVEPQVGHPAQARAWSPDRPSAMPE